MLHLDQTEPPSSDELDPFSLCRNTSELIAIAEMLLGRELTLWCLQMAEAERQPLQRDARELKRTNPELAEVISNFAKTRPRAPWWRAKRQPGKWRTPSAEIVIARRKAERQATEGR